VCVCLLQKGLGMFIWQSSCEGGEQVI
jgi:hypothetical protein